MSAVCILFLCGTTVDAITLSEAERAYAHARQAMRSDDYDRASDEFLQLERQLVPLTRTENRAWWWLALADYSLGNMLLYEPQMTISDCNSYDLAAQFFLSCVARCAVGGYTHTWLWPKAKGLVSSARDRAKKHGCAP